MNVKWLTPQQIILCLFILDYKSMGRYKLSEYLNLSIARTRILLKLLIDNEYASTKGKSSGKTGTYLTNKAKKIMNKLKSYFSVSFKQNLVFDKEFIFNSQFHSILLLELKTMNSNGLFERDLAVRTGAFGSILLIKTDNKWYLPGNIELDSKLIDIDKLNKFGDYNSCFVIFGNEEFSIFRSAIEISFYYFENELLEQISDLIS